MTEKLMWQWRYHEDCDEWHLHMPEMIPDVSVRVLRAQEPDHIIVSFLKNPPIDLTILQVLVRSAYMVDWWKLLEQGVKAIALDQKSVEDIAAKIRIVLEKARTKEM